MYTFAKSLATFILCSLLTIVRHIAYNGKYTQYLHLVKGSLTTEIIKGANMPSMITYENKTIIETLQSWLDESRLTQADLARKTKRTTGGISLVFTGQRRPSAQLLVQIAEACGKPPE